MQVSKSDSVFMIFGVKPFLSVPKPEFFCEHTLFKLINDLRETPIVAISLLHFAVRQRDIEIDGPSPKQLHQKFASRIHIDLLYVIYRECQLIIPGSIDDHNETTFAK